MKFLPTFLIFVMLSVAVLAFSALSSQAYAFEDPCADGSCNPPVVDPCFDGSCDPPIFDPCADGSCDEPDTCFDGSCDPPIVDPCADGTCAPPDPCADGSCEPPIVDPCADGSCEPDTPSPTPDDGGEGDGDDDGSAPAANNPPVISSFSVPAAAGRNTDITLTVTATDSDGGVNRIEILKDSVVIATESCGSIISCTKSFIVRVPDAFSAVYTFVARVFDNLGAVVTASGSGRTSPAPVAPLPVPSPEPERVLEAVKVSIPSDELFISTIVPDTACLAPGAETFLYVSMSNRGRKALGDVKITAIVEDLNIRAVSGPFSLRKGDSASRFLYFGVPEDAKPGNYYIRVSVTSGKDSVVKYRIFEVNRAC